MTEISTGGFGLTQAAGQRFAAIAPARPATGTAERAVREPAVRVSLSPEAVEANKRDLELVAAMASQGQEMERLYKASSLSKPFAEIRKDGKVIATIFNSGVVGFPDGTPSRILNAVGDNDPLFDDPLEQNLWRAKAIASAAGGEIVLADTAVLDTETLKAEKAVFELAMAKLTETADSMRRRFTELRGEFRGSQDIPATAAGAAAS